MNEELVSGALTEEQARHLPPWIISKIKIEEEKGTY
jgi:hypothetical protein